MKKKLLWIVLLIIVIAGTILFFKFAKPKQNEESLEAGDISFNRNSEIEERYRQRCNLRRLSGYHRGNVHR